MKPNILTLVIILIAIMFTNSCKKDDITSDKENLPSTAEWTFLDESGYGSNRTTFIKNKKIEDGKNYVEFRVFVTKAGTYNLSTETINGIKYSGTGNLVVKAEGSYQAVQLWASGTPLASGTNQFKVTSGGLSVNFSTNVLPFDKTELASKIVIRASYNDWYDRGNLTAYKASTGEVEWNVTVSGWISQADVVADTIFINNSDFLEARNINTGVLLWSISHTDVDGYKSSYNGVTYYKGILYCSTNDGHVLVFKSSNGSFVHDFNLETTSVVGSIPVVANNVMFVGHSYLWAFNTNGTLKWKYTLPGFSRSGTTVDNGIVYISTDNGELCAINVADGTLKWKYTVGTTGEECPTVANGKVYSGNKNLYCLDATTGQLIWQKNDIDFEWHSPNIFNNTLYVGGKGTLHSLNASTGETIWETPGSLAISSEIVACDKFLVSNSAGLYAQYAENGARLWSNINYQSFDAITLNPIIYDKVTKEVFLTSSYGNKK